MYTYRLNAGSPLLSDDLRGTVLMSWGYKSQPGADFDRLALAFFSLSSPILFWHFPHRRCTTQESFTRFVCSVFDQVSPTTRPFLVHLEPFVTTKALVVYAFFSSSLVPLLPQLQFKQLLSPPSPIPSSNTSFLLRKHVCEISCFGYCRPSSSVA